MAGRKAGTLKADGTPAKKPARRQPAPDSDLLIGGGAISSYLGLSGTTIEYLIERCGFPVSILPDGRIVTSKVLVRNWILISWQIESKIRGWKQTHRPHVDALIEMVDRLIEDPADIAAAQVALGKGQVDGTEETQTQTQARYVVNGDGHEVPRRPRPSCIEEGCGGDTLRDVLSQPKYGGGKKHSQQAALQSNIRRINRLLDKYEREREYS